LADVSTELHRRGFLNNTMGLESLMGVPTTLGVRPAPSWDSFLTVGKARVATARAGLPRVYEGPLDLHSPNPFGYCAPEGVDTHRLFVKAFDAFAFGLSILEIMAPDAALRAVTCQYNRLMLDHPMKFPAEGHERFWGYMERSMHAVRQGEMTGMVDPMPEESTFLGELVRVFGCCRCPASDVARKRLNIARAARRKKVEAARLLAETRARALEVERFKSLCCVVCGKAGDSRLCERCATNFQRGS
jgi:hypothetical protein